MKKQLNSLVRRILVGIRVLLPCRRGFDEQVHDHVLRIDFTDVDHAVAQILGRARLSRFQRETLADGYRHLTDQSDIVVLSFDDGRRDGGSSSRSMRFGVMGRIESQRHGQKSATLNLTETSSRSLLPDLFLQMLVAIVA